MKLKYSISSLVLAVLLAACSNKETGESGNGVTTDSTQLTVENKQPEHNQAPVNLDWLIGNWRDSTTWSFKKAQIIEKWTKSNGVFSGTGIHVKNLTDTTIAERIDIDCTGEPIFFSVDVTGQNNGETIHFELSNYSTDSVRFENMAHDFPQVISYRLITSDSIHATAAGYTSNGNWAKQTTKLVRY